MIERNEGDNDLISITDAAKMLHVTRQAIYVALRKRGLPAIFQNRQWMIKRKDLINYQMNKYSREKSKFNGAPLFDMHEYSVNHLAKRLGVHPQHVYYLLRRGVLKADKRGSAWIISEEEIERVAYERGYHLVAKEKCKMC